MSSNNRTIDHNINGRSYLFTSESVSEGHPDKLADRISDSILDHYLKYDHRAKVAAECLVAHDLVVIAGEIYTAIPGLFEKAEKDIPDIVHQVIRGPPCAEIKIR